MKPATRTYVRDVLSAVLYSGTFYAVTPLIPFIAMKRPGAEHPMVPFNTRQFLVTAFGDQRFRRLALLLTLYGVFGVGIKTVLVVFYNDAGFSEFEVGVFSSITTIGMVITNLLVTPFLRLLLWAEEYP